MLSGLIIYSSKDKERNHYFINKCLGFFADKDVSVVYKDEKDVFDYLRKNVVHFVIYRGRDYELVEQLERLGIKCFNNSYTNKIANDKFLTCKFLNEQNIPCIQSYESPDEIGCYPTVMKSIDGHGGQEVFLVSSRQQAEAISKRLKKRFVYQQFYKNNGDLRLYVVNKKVIGAVHRHSNADFRSNFSLGGEVKSYEPEKEIVDLAVKVATILDADYIGVDFMKVDDKWLINEIEDPVGCRMLYVASNIDAIELFLDYVYAFLYDK